MNRERGQALILVLILLAVGSLLIIPSLQLTTTVLKGRAMYAQFIKEDYTADAAIEYSLWRLNWEPDFAADNFTTIGNSVNFEVTLNGVTASTSITMQATEGLSGVGLAKEDYQIKPTKEVTPDTASPGVETTFTYTITMQRLEPDDNQFDLLEKIKDAMEPGFIYVSNSSALDGVPFDDDDLTILKEKVRLGPLTSFKVGANADAMVTQVSPDQNYGSELTMDVQSGVPAPQYNARSLVKFDVSGFPAGVTLERATLRLAAMAAPGVTRTYEVHLVTDSWSESSVTWNNQPAVAAAATDSDTTPPEILKNMKWDVTANVQSWLDGATNKRWRIQDVAEGSATP